MNEDQITEARSRLEAIRAEVREDLAADLGGSPDDYRAERHFQDATSESDDSVVSDGGT